MPEKHKSQQPWQRLPKESAPAFAAFSAYLELGPERSLQAVSQKLGKSRTLLSRWSSAYEWQNRTRAWDDYLQQQARQQAVASMRKMTKRHLEIAQQIQSAALQALQRKGSNMVTPQNFAAVIRLATDLERESQQAQVEQLGAVPGGQPQQDTLLDAILQMDWKEGTDDLPEVE